eukprot:6412682-Ditylum_brightwellii.AAC.1
MTSQRRCVPNDDFKLLATAHADPCALEAVTGAGQAFDVDDVYTGPGNLGRLAGPLNPPQHKEPSKK